MLDDMGSQGMNDFSGDHDGTRSHGTDRVVNSHFVQLTRDESVDIGQLILEDHVAGVLLHLMLKHMGKNNVVVMSSQVMQEATGKSRTTITRAVKKLLDERWVQAIRIGSARGFAVNEKVAWTDRADKRRHAVFSATVVASRSEQEESELQFDKSLRRVSVVEKISGQ